MRVTFRCKRSGNTVSFSNEDDIAALRKHESYTEVSPEQAQPTTPETQLPEFLAPQTEIKRRGRRPGVE